MHVIRLNDSLTCPKCKTKWTGDYFTTGMEPPSRPKCGQCGHVFK